ncbi:MAG: phage tail assembly protein [Candidatus Thermofonsia bacterium]|nr:MAG: phage tail assembly protein [Candidatus Thermofonsia bacterium]
MQTEFAFTLPKGLVLEDGTVTRNGRIRLATALDEIEAMAHPQVQANPAYLPVVLLSRVITALEGVTAVTPRTIEHLFAADLAYLEDIYLRLNSHQHTQIGAVCPVCSSQFQVQVAPLS